MFDDTGFMFGNACGRCGSVIVAASTIVSVVMQLGQSRTQGVMS
jgi:hypothetical protein